MEIFNSDQDIRHVLMQLINGTYCAGGSGAVPGNLQFPAEYDEYSDRADTYFILKDFRSYADAQKKVEAAYRDEKGWAKSAILNTASSGKFTSDRTIRQYVDEIWHLDQMHVELDYYK